jgi:hypothetical protein
MTDKKFVYANIRVPIELKGEGESYEIHSDYMKIEFEICTELPEKMNSDNQDLLQKIFSVHPSSSAMMKEEIMKVFSSDFDAKHAKVRLNSSFRKKNNRTKQFTRRSYSIKETVSL